VAKAARRFHLFMALTCSTIVSVCLPGCVFTSIMPVDIRGILLGMTVILVVMLPLPVYWHEKGNEERRDAVLVLLWTMVLAILLRYPVLVAARLRMPLRDAVFASLDGFLGVNVPAVMEWAARHSWAGIVFNKSYVLLHPLLPVAILLNALTGRRSAVQELLVANVIAFAISLPLLALFPAVGPWTIYHFPPHQGQLQCESFLAALRSNGTFLAEPGHSEPIVCFPSFHVIWAILSARALWGFRSLRIPAGILATLISISTITTGWHYFVDVLGGMGVAAVSILAANAYLLGIGRHATDSATAAICHTHP
jgi:membrane-associated phospholipid phosphatase